MADNYSPIANGQNGDENTFNGPLQELDDAIENVKDGSAPLSTPDITSFTNSAHDHSNAAGGGQIDETAIDSSGAGGANETLLSDGVGGTGWGVILTSLLTTKGDIMGYDTSAARVAIGSDGHTLFADSTQALGLKWALPLQVAIGEYTGDGAGAAGSGGQLVSGLSFQPDIIIIAHKDMINAADQIIVHTNDSVPSREGVTAVGATSFTVSDGGIDFDPNGIGINYVYIIAEINA